MELIGGGGASNGHPQTNLQDPYCQKRLNSSVRRSSLQISAGNDAAEDKGN